MIEASIVWINCGGHAGKFWNYFIPYISTIILKLNDYLFFEILQIPDM